LFGYVDKTTGAHVPGFLEQTDTLALAFKKYTEETVWVDDQKQEHKLWDEVLKCLAITRTKGVHAGGVIITPGAVHDYMPLITPKEEGILSTAYTMKSVEEVGGVKYDFLGVKTLKSLGISMRALRDNGVITLDWEEFPHDPEVYEQIIHRGLLAGLFQISTTTMRPYTLKIKPRDVMGISNICSLVRPGALDAPSPDPVDPPTVSAADYYVLCAQGVKRPYYIHDDLIPILSNSYGVILTQEQTLRIFRDLAGYTYETAEVVRRGVAKKEKALLEEHGAILRRKCIERGWTEEQAAKLFESIMASAKYSFNCAHSTSYAIMCYNGAWLKRHHPAYFWLGELTVRMGDQDKLREYLNECSKYILPVSITKSYSTEWRVEMVDGHEMLRPPLQVVKGCGPKSVDNIKAFLDAKSVGELFEKLVEVDEDHDERIDALTPEQIDAGEHYEFMDVE
jgi:DNA polymerase-3 subunit alpha